MALRSVLFLAACFAGATSGPLTVSNQQCATNCPDKNVKFNYEPGKTYSYDYTAETETSLAGASEDISRLKVTAKAEFVVKTKCNLVLKLQDVNIVQSSVSSKRSGQMARRHDLETLLQNYPLTFSFQDGTIESVCPSTGDSTWALNFKKGILSAFQNSMKDLNRNQLTTETDVSGKCSANYVINHRGWDSILITKTKDLTTCTSRNSHENFGAQLFPHFSSGAENLPILKSTYKCDQEIHNKLIDASRCKESYIFHPFSTGESGVRTSITQNLVFVRIQDSQSERHVPHTSRSSLLFDHQPRLDGTSKLQEAQKTLNDLCEATADGLPPETPNLFRSLVYQMRQLNRQQLKDLFTKVSSCINNEAVVKKFYIDALHVAMTPDAVALMKDFVIGNELSDPIKDSWLMSLAFVPTPTKSLIINVAPLLDQPSPRQKAVLGISALIHTYCHQHTDCSSDPAIQAVIQKFSRLVQYGCQPTDDQQLINVLVALKAIGNIGYLPFVDENLQTCITSSQTPVEIRVAAIEALRRSPCNSKHSTLLQLLGDSKEDVEVRIASYLSLMRCPTPDTIVKVAMILKSEEINQVGSFIWTHLTNIQNTRAPVKRDIRGILQSHVLRQKFITDARKFSRNYEHSLYWESLKTGVHGEANVIFTPKSYLPRSIGTNLTVELFGHAINLIEVGGRIEGFEHWMESMFGPEGLYPENTVKDLLQTMRGKRSVDGSTISQIDEQFAAKEEFTENPQASGYVRLFGNDLHYMRYKNDNEGSKNSFGDFLSWLIKDEETALTQSFTFVDTTFVVPTAIGLPLNLTLNGTASVQLLMKGHTQIKELAKLDCEINGYIKPSAVVRVSGTMGVGTDDLQQGIRLEANLHSATSISGKIELRGGRLIKVEMDAPKKTMNIMGITTQLYLLDGKEPIYQSGITDNRDAFTGCTGSWTGRPLGVELCGIISYPNASHLVTAPGFPLTGPTTIGLYLRKMDNELATYNFEFRKDNQQISGERGSIITRKLSFNTPGSSVDRELSAEFVLNQPEKTIVTYLRTPFKKLGLRGKLINEDKRKRIDGSISVDDVEKMSLQAELQQERSGNIIRYLPSLLVKLPSGRPISFKGIYINDRGKKIGLDMTLENLTSRPINIFGDVTIGTNNQMDFDLGVRSYFLTSQIKGTAQTINRNVLVSLVSEHSLFEGPRKLYEGTLKFKDGTYGHVRKILASGEAHGAGIGSLAGSWEFQHKPGFLENQIELSANSKTFTTRQVFTVERDTRSSRFSGFLTAQCPTTGFDWSLTASHLRNGTYTDSSIAIHHGSERQGGVQLETHYSLTDLPNIGAEMTISRGKNESKLAATVKKINLHEYEGMILIQLEPNEKIHAKGNYQDYSSPVAMRHGVKLEVQTPWHYPLRLSGDLSTGNMYSTTGNLEYGQKKYGYSVKYDPVHDDGHKISTEVSLDGKRHNGIVSLKFNGPKTRFFMDFQPDGTKPFQTEVILNRGDGNIGVDLNVRWDIDGDVGKEVAVKVEVGLLKNGVQVEIQLDGICKKHQLFFRTETEGGLLSPQFSHSTIAKLITDQDQYSTDIDIYGESRGPHKEMAISMLMTTPFVGAKDIRGLAKCIFDDQRWSITGGYTADGTEYKLSSTGHIRSWAYQNYDFDGNLKMEIGNQKLYNFAINHKSNSNGVTTSVELPPVFWVADQQIKATVTSSKTKLPTLKSNRFNGNLTFSTPYGNVYGLTARHDSYISGQRGITALRASRNEKYMSLDLARESVNDLNKFSFTGTGVFTSPFKGYENIIGSTSTTFGYNNLQSQSEFSWAPGNSVSCRVTGSLQSDKDSTRAAGTLNVMTPFTDIKNLRLQALYEATKHDLKSSLEAQWAPDEIASVLLEVNTPTNKKLHISTIVSTPLRGWTEVTAVWKHELEDWFRSNLKLTKGADSLELDVSGKVSIDKDGHSLQGNLSFVTSGKGLDFYSSVDHKVKDKKINSKLETRLSDGTFSISETGVYTNMMNFENKLQWATEDKNVEIMIKHTNQESFKHSSSLIIDSKKYAMDLEVKGKSPTVAVCLYLATPTRIYGPYNGNFTWESKGNVQEMSFGLEYAEGKEFVVGSSLDLTKQQGKVNMKIKTPIKGFQDIAVSCIYSLDEIPARLGLVIEWDSSRRIDIMTSGKFDIYRSDINVEVKTMFEGYENLAAGIKYDVTAPSKKMSLNVFGSLNKKTMKLQGSLQMNRAGTVDLSVLVVNSVQGWEDITLRLKLGNSKEGRTTRLVLRNGGKKLESSIVFGTQQISARLSTPYEGYRTMLLEWKMRQSRSDFETSVTARRDQFSSATSVIYRKRSNSELEVVILWNIPTYDISLGVSANAQISEHEMRGTATLHHNDHKVEVAGEMSGDSKKKMTFLRLSSPIKGFEEIRVTGKYENSDPFHYLTSLDWEWGGKGLHLAARLTNERDSGQASVSLTSDMISIPTFIASAEYDYSTPAKRMTAALVMDERKAKVVGTWTVEYTRHEGSLIISSNFDGEEREIGASYNYDFGHMQKRAVVVLKKDGKALDITATYEPNTKDHPGSFVMSVEDDLSHRKYYAINVNHETLQKVKVIDFLFHVGPSVNEFEVKWSSDEKSIDFSTKVKVPFMRYKNIQVIGRAEKQEETEHKVAVKIIIDSQVTELAGRLTRENGNGEFHLAVTSPKEESESSITGNYNFVSQEKTFQVKLQSHSNTAEISGKFSGEKTKGSAEFKYSATRSDVEKSFSWLGQFDTTNAERTASMAISSSTHGSYSIHLAVSPGRYKGSANLRISSPVHTHLTFGSKVEYNLDPAKTSVSAFAWINDKQWSVNASGSIIEMSGSVDISRPNEKNIVIKLVPSLTGDLKSVVLSMVIGTDHRSRISFEWHLNRLGGELKLQAETSFEDFKKFLIHLEYDTKSKTQMNLLAMWPSNHWQKLEVSFKRIGIELVEAKGHLLSLNGDIQQVIVKYDIQNQQKTSIVALQSGSAKLELLCQFTPWQNIHLEVKTPHPEYKVMILEGKIDKPKTTMSVSGTWDEKRLMVSVVYALALSKTSVEAELQSSFPSLRMAGATFQYDFSKPDVQFKVNCRLNQAQIEFSLQTALSPQRPDRPLLEAILQWNEGQKMTLSVEAKRDGQSGLVSIKLTTPKEKCKTNEITAKYAGNGWQRRGDIAIEFCEHSTTMAALLNIEDSKGNILFTLTTANSPRVNLKGNYDLNRNGENAILTLTVGKEKIEAKGNVIRQDKSIQTQLTVFGISKSPITITGNYDYKELRKIFNVEIGYSIDQKIQIAGDVTLGDAGFTSTNMQFTAPSVRPEDVKLGIKYVKNRDKLSGDVTIEWGSGENQRFEVSGTVTDKSFEFFLDAPAKSLNKIRINGGFDTRSGFIKLNGGLSASDKAIFSVLFKIQHDLPYFLSLEAGLMTTFTGKFDVNISHICRDFLESSIILQTPIQSLKTIKVIVQYMNQRGKVNISTSFSTPRHFWKLFADFDVDNPNKLQGKIGSKTSLKSIPEFTLSAEYNYDGRYAEGSAHLQFPDGTVHRLQGAIDIAEGNIDFSGQLDSSLFGPDAVELRGSGTYGDQKLHLQLTASCNKATHSLKSTWRTDGQSIDGTLTINCPYISLQEVKVHLNGTFVPQRLEGLMRIDHAGKIHKVHGILETRQNIKLLLSVDSPIIPLTAINFALATGSDSIDMSAEITTTSSYNFKLGTVVHRKEAGNRKTELELSLWKGRTVHKMEAEFNCNKYAATGKITVTTPDSYFGTAIFNYQINYRVWQLDYNTDFHLNGKQILGGTGYFELSETLFSIKLTGYTTILKIGEISAELNRTNFDNNTRSLQLTIGRNHVINKLTLAITPENHKWNFIAKLILLEGTNYERSMNFRIDTQYDQELSLKMGFTVKEMEFNAISLSANLTTNRVDTYIAEFSSNSPKFPVMNYPVSLTAKIVHDGVKNNELKLVVDTSFHTRILFFSGLQITSQEVDFVLKISPLLGLKHFQLTTKFVLQQKKWLGQGSLIMDSTIYRLFTTAVTEQNQIHGSATLETSKTQYTINFQGHKIGGLYEGSVKISKSASSDEIEISGNVNIKTAMDVDATVSVKTPFHRLKSATATGGYKIDSDRMMSINLDINTSNPSFKNLTIRGTFNHSRVKLGDPNFTINMRTPFKEFKTVMIEGSVTADSQHSHDAWVTVTLPRRIYQIYGHLKNRYDHKFIKVGGNLNGVKHEFIAGFKSRSNHYDVQLALTVSSWKVFSISGECWTDRRARLTKYKAEVAWGEQQQIAGSAVIAILPEGFSINLELDTSNKNWKKTAIFYSKSRQDDVDERKFEVQFGVDQKLSLILRLGDDEASLNFITPLKNLHNGTAMYRRVDNRIILELSCNGKQIVKVNVAKREDQYIAQMSAPYQMLVSWTLKRDGQRLLINGELTSDLTRRQETTTRWDYEDTESNGEMIKTLSIYSPYRTIKVVLTQTVKDMQRLKLDFTWDEEKGKTISFEFKLRKGLTPEAVSVLEITLSLPTRDFKIQGSCQQTPDRLEVGGGFSWDRRDRTKAIVLKLTVQDEGRRLLYGMMRRRSQLSVQFPNTRDEWILRVEERRSSTTENFFIRAELDTSPEDKLIFQAVVKDRSTSDSAFFFATSLAHPQSTSNLQLIIDVKDNKDETTLKLKLMSRSKAIADYSLDMNCTVDKSSNVIQYSLQSPEVSAKLVGQLTKTSDRHVVELKGYIDGSKPIVVIFEVDHKQRGISVDYLYDPNEQHHLIASASMPSGKAIMLEASHGPNDELIQDVKSILRLNKSRSLEGLFQWRPGAILEAMDEYAHQYFGTKRWLTNAGEKTTGSIKDALLKKLELISEIFNKQRILVVRIWEEEKKSVQHDFTLLMDDLKTMYDRNEFFLKDGEKVLKKLDYYLGDYVRWTVRNSLNFISHSAFTIQAYTERLMKFIGDAFVDGINSMDGCVRDVQHGVRRFAQDAYGTVKVYHRHLWNLLTDLATKAQEKLNPWIQKWTSMVNEYLDRIETKIYGYMDNARDYIEDLITRGKSIPAVRRLIDLVADWLPDEGSLKKLRDYYSTLAAKSKKLMDSVVNHPTVSAIRDFSSKIYGKASWTYNYWAVEEHARSLLHQLDFHAREILADILHHLVSESPDLVYKSPKVILDADRGHFYFQQPLPFSWENFDQLPKFDVSTELDRLKDWKNKMVDKMEGLYNEYKPKLNMNAMMPPFEGRAFISGQQHYMTFDGRLYEFSGPCSYLLARDFVDGNFTAIVNYKLDGQMKSVVKKSLLLQFDKTAIEINSDYAVIVDNKKIELPIRIGSVTVTREGNSILVRKARHVEVQCLTAFDLCTVQISGWYHGKTGGLLGTFDNEPANDFVTSKRDHTDDVVQFARSWEVGPKTCTTRTNSATEVDPEENRSWAKICKELLDDVASPLHTCFDKVNPSPFLRMCINDMSEDARAQIGVRHFASVAAYVMECNYRNVHVKMPNECVHCQLPKGVLTASRSDILQGSSRPYASDVVFLVEEQSCMKENTRLIPELMRTLEATLLATHNVHDNKYAVIGYGGKDIHDLPHVHTADGKLFSSSRSAISLALPSLQVNDPGSTDLLTALRYVADLPFRAGSSKPVVVLSCTVDGRLYTNADFDITRQSVERNGLVVHLVNGNGFTNLGTSKTVVGIDSEINYLVESAQARTEPSMVNFDTLPIPAKIALMSNGSYFSHSHLVIPKPKLAKATLNLFINRVVSTAQTEICQECRCFADHFGEGRTECKPCTDKMERPQSDDSIFYRQLRGFVNQVKSSESTMARY